MATPGELSLEEIRNYLLENGGTARNHDLVKHFKRFLTDPETRGGLNFRPDTHIRGCLVARRRLTLRFCDVNTCEIRRMGLGFEHMILRYSGGEESIQGIRQHLGHHKKRGGRLRGLSRSCLSLPWQERLVAHSATLPVLLARQLKNTAPSYYRRVIVIVYITRPVFGHIEPKLYVVVLYRSWM